MRRVGYGLGYLIAYWFLLVSAVSAHPVPESIAEDVANVIQVLPVEQFKFTLIKKNNSENTLVSLCSDNNGGYGLVPFNVSEPACWVYDKKKEKLTSTRQFEMVFETDSELETYAKLFLGNQPNPNEGVWVSTPETVCYSLANRNERKNYCLKSEELDVTSSTSNPTQAERDPSGDAATYTLVGLTLFVLTMVGIGVERKWGCCRYYFSRM